MTIIDWNIKELTGYKPLTTFYTDFSIADKFGIESIRNTFDNTFESWKEDYKFLTELAMVLSWKSFEHEKDNDLCKLYSKLYYIVDSYACENLTKEELSYYFRTTD
jgi:hypothetical protein